VAAATRGHLLIAFKAHPFGLFVVLGLAAATVTGAAGMATGRPMPSWLCPRLWWAWVAAIALPAGWILKILRGAADGTLPMR